MQGTNVVGDDVPRKPMRTLRVQVIREDSTTFLCSRDDEWADTSEHVRDNILGLEQPYKAIVFSV